MAPQLTLVAISAQFLRNKVFLLHIVPLALKLPEINLNRDGSGSRTCYSLCGLQLPVTDLSILLLLMVIA